MLCGMSTPLPVLPVPQPCTSCTGSRRDLIDLHSNIILHKVSEHNIIHYNEMDLTSDKLPAASCMHVRELK